MLDLRSCCSCESTMRTVFARGVQLDWCQFCGGIFFDRGELTGVLGRAPELVTQGAVSGLCAACRSPMERAMIGPLPACACQACDGVFLPSGELDQLVGGQVALSRIPEHPGESVTFPCSACHERRPLSEAVSTPKGIVCPRCASAAPADAKGTASGLDAGDAAAIDAALRAAAANPTPPPPSAAWQTTLEFTRALVSILFAFWGGGGMIP